MRNAERVQITHQLARIGKAEAGIELHAIGRKRASAVFVGRKPVHALGDAARFGNQDVWIGSHGAVTGRESTRKPTGEGLDAKSGGYGHRPRHFTKCPQRLTRSDFNPKRGKAGRVVLELLQDWTG